MSKSLFNENLTDISFNTARVKSHLKLKDESPNHFNSSSMPYKINSSLVSAIEKLNFDQTAGCNEDQDQDYVIFKKKISKLNLKFYIETQKYLNMNSDKEHCQESLFLILFNQISIYSSEVARLKKLIDCLQAQISEFKSELNKHTMTQSSRNKKISDSRVKPNKQILIEDIYNTIYEDKNESLGLKKGERSMMLINHLHESSKEKVPKKRTSEKCHNITKDLQQFISIKENLSHKSKQNSMQSNSNQTRQLQICTNQQISDPNYKSPKAAREGKSNGSPMWKQKPRIKWSASSQNRSEELSLIILNLDKEILQLSQIEAMMTGMKLELSSTDSNQITTEYSSPHFMIDLFSFAD